MSKPIPHDACDTAVARARLAGTEDGTTAGGLYMQDVADEDCPRILAGLELDDPETIDEVFGALAVPEPDGDAFIGSLYELACEAAGLEPGNVSLKGLLWHQVYDGYDDAFAEAAEAEIIDIARDRAGGSAWHATGLQHAGDTGVSIAGYLGQSGQSFSVRYLRMDRPGAMITHWVCPVAEPRMARRILHRDQDRMAGLRGPRQPVRDRGLVGQLLRPLGRPGSGLLLQCRGRRTGRPRDSHRSGRPGRRARLGRPGLLAARRRAVMTGAAGSAPVIEGIRVTPGLIAVVTGGLLGLITICWQARAQLHMARLARAQRLPASTQAPAGGKGRTVLAAGGAVTLAGWLYEKADHSSAPSAAPKPVPAPHPAAPVIHPPVPHAITQAAHPLLSGWQIVIIVAVLAVGGLVAWAIRRM